MAARELVPPPGAGQRCKLTMDSMGQLASFVTDDNVTRVQFSYVDNSGLIESKETGDGRTTVYEYDDYGRMSAVVQPTGRRIDIVDTDQTTGAGATRCQHHHQGRPQTFKNWTHLRGLTGTRV